MEAKPRHADVRSSLLLFWRSYSVPSLYTKVAAFPEAGSEGPVDVWCPSHTAPPHYDLAFVYTCAFLKHAPMKQGRVSKTYTRVQYVSGWRPDTYCTRVYMTVCTTVRAHHCTGRPLYLAHVRLFTSRSRTQSVNFTRAAYASDTTSRGGGDEKHVMRHRGLSDA